MNCEDPVTVLYPPTGEQRPLRNLYRDLPLEPPDRDPGLFIYSNFVTSLDGRIALEVPGSSGVPAQIANPRDWRLFQELAARTDVLITSGRYLRQFAAGTAQHVLPVGGDEDFRDLRDWRLAQGLPAQPDVAVVSAGLDFAVPERLLAERERVLVFTGDTAPGERRRQLTAQGCRVVVCDGGPAVSGAGIAAALAEAGYERAYSVTGPQILRGLLADGVLDTLFLTHALRMLGGRNFDTIVKGDVLGTAPTFALRSLYLDTFAPDGAMQLLACYDRRR